VPMGVYRLGYYPHNVHFVMASALMAGDGPSGISAAEKLRALVPDQAALAIPGAHPVKAAPYFAHALFSPPDVILALPDPGMAIPYVKAMWHYARGIAYVERRDLSAATTEASAIEALARTADAALHGAAVLVLSGASITRGCVDAGGPTRRCGGSVPARPCTCAE